MQKHRKLRIFLAACGVAFLLIGAFSLLRYMTGYEIHRDIAYGEKDENIMDIYLPTGVSKEQEKGCVLFIHGGSWSGGDKKEEALRCRLLASRGYVAATINYTLWSEESESEYSVFTVLDEIDAALLRLKEFAKEHGTSISKAALSGYSAGSHLAMLYSYSRGNSAPMEIVFTVNMAGPADISPEVWGTDMTVRVANRLLTEEITEDMLSGGEADELLESISPTSFIAKDTPPTIIIHGGEDTVVPIENAESLVEKLSQNSVEYDYVRLRKSDHNLIGNPVGHLKFLMTFLSYCERYFGY